MQKRTLPFTCPASGEQFGEVAIMSAEEVSRAAAELRAVKPEWVGKPLSERIRVLRRFQQELLDQADEISALISKDTGKSRQDALVEVFITVDNLAYQLKHAREWLRTQHVSSRYLLFKRSFIEYRPHGVVLVLAPWNYPLALALPPVLSALLAGNAVLFKPSEVTAACGVMIEKLFLGLPELGQYVRVLHGDISTGEAAVRAGVDYIFLTGSTQTGKKVMHAAADQLIPVSFELGGKDAMIVLEDADVSAAARWGVWGAVYNAGQACMSVERVYVVDAVYDRFVERALQQMELIRTGYSEELESPYHMGPITDPRQLEIIQRHLADARKKGARILHGGEARDHFIEPVLLVNADHSMQIMQEETFGPVMPIVRVNDEEEALRLANDSEYGLSASIWSKNLPRARRLARRVQAGSVVLNDTIAHFAVASLPFGGVKGSGWGRIHGREGLMQFVKPYGYVVGKPPNPLDLAAVMRRPGMYWLGRAVMHLLFGTTLKKRLGPLADRKKLRRKL
jgi:acyl-CoA reductase-like NAD-dependent aldehyde dehydrogenase